MEGGTQGYPQVKNDGFETLVCRMRRGICVVPQRGEKRVERGEGEVSLWKRTEG